MPTKRVILAEYFTVEDRTLLFIVRDDFKEPEVIEIPVGTEAIQQIVIKHFQAERNAAGQVVKSTKDKVLNLDEAVYQSFFAPFVAPLVSNSSQGDIMTEEGDIIWLVPHNFLHYLPLHALQVEGRYLIERNPVCYTPSASVMKYCHAKRKNRREKALILADSCSDRLHTQEQGIAIKQLFQPDAELYIGNEVTKDLLVQKLQQSKADIDILHIACHGEFNAVEALKSGIQLAQEEKLTAEEILGLDLNLDLVTLSACESGINANKPGDELIGLTRALIYAGTPSVVVSLWEVDQISTSILMSKFYQKLKDRANKAEALQQAQIELRNMTAQDVIDYCVAAKKRLNNPIARLLLDFNIADMRQNARDFEGAVNDYNRLLQETEKSSKEYEQMLTALEACEFVLDPLPVDYQRAVYDHLYYWSPFILVGDWR
ncbi:MAG: CHAT domain-containing protein [Microcoleus sp. PH2017_25_DOB_D_A]|uniref:CHAT domain-containing protein n=1 Tax=unclassified Microcoleus TaxID=2642155 RepID=UPI001D6E98B3|nr:MULTISPECIES: CHAT domain-containing protein [unclassified Microcoleus]MCC3509495.1 CHAT domain-containing protein [Microcoleus sp. PH2017_17_BER_D_A]TAE40433.1 MAG: CHAT domain-containing protein [Oscillatoriales cyanobacterium]MCC3499426.1 CHAT domain-containing protein [Microcoleus sp. PH2017_15_JOR_U_A]MCC3535546.1 CHAT domain-containing protein [Microcoleus sp. PH2017_25_DOB_D_A]MCC3545486.1 CHAT domain-containing protein [Microcoleus sp. PH2017_24_DOB_U_A]